nr:chromate ion transporter [Aspergillus niger CBS 513.88]|eukprot:XP_001388560.2 chromate ion transporter [Aspergillus niger CBS 513.88]
MLLLTHSRPISSLRALHRSWRSHAGATDPARAEEPLLERLGEVVRHTWYLGFTSFGGPPVHFQIFHARFVEQEKWVDEQTLHAGFIPAILAFVLWCLPGAVGMYALSLGVQRIDETLPAAVYALLSGLNASTVGIVALAAVQLAEKAIRDKIARILVIFGACAGLCYSALWYFPVLMVAGGVTTALNRQPEPEGDEPGSAGRESSSMQSPEQGARIEMLRMRKSGAEASPPNSTNIQAPEGGEAAPAWEHIIRIRVGAAILIFFFASFIAILVTRAKLSAPPLSLELFANMYLAGTVIFGGGPVVIPLLRSYVVDPGWVSSRDFLIGLAIIQAFPGPNFNFAVFLGALAVRTTSYPTVFGAFLCGLGIFFPGITLAVAIQSFWRVLRKQDRDGQSLAKEPWWVVIAAVTYAQSAWFKVPPAVAIVLGAVLGLCWYEVVSPAW